MRTDRTATGHFDCCGDMIYNGDTVTTRRGDAVVFWVGGGRWMLHYDDAYVESLNRYGKDDIRRVEQRVEQQWNNGTKEVEQ